MEERLQIFFYRFMFVLLLGSIVFFVGIVITESAHIWRGFLYVTHSVLLVFVWCECLLLFWHDIKRPCWKPYRGEMIYVIIPCYNEDPALLCQSIESVQNAQGNKKIIIINDGSTNGIKSELEHVKGRHRNIHIYHLPENKGKRYAMYIAMKKVNRFIARRKERNTFVVAMDSDTVIEPQSLVRIVEPLKSKQIGAVVGEVRLINQYKNLLTYIASAYYWVAFNMGRRSNAQLGMVSCCSGAFAAYQTNLAKKFIRKYYQQTFMGVQCVNSNDRHLTNLILKAGYRTVYSDKAVCYTRTPQTLFGFMKQQQRWRRGSIRESAYTLSFAWRNKKFLFLQLFFYHLNYPFYTFGLRLALIIALVIQPSFFLSIGVVWIISAVVRHVYVVFHAPQKLPGIILYTLFHEVFLYWQSIYALFTAKQMSWMTR